MLKIALIAHNMKFFQEIYDEMHKQFEIRTDFEPQVRLPGLGSTNSGPRSFLRKQKMKSLMSWSDISFFEWTSGYLIEATNLKKKYSKIVTRLHSFEIAYYADKVNWNKVDKIILVCEAMRKRFLKMFPEVPKDKTVVINNVVNLDKLKFIPNKKFQSTLGTLAYISPEKRIYELVLAFAEIHKDMPELKFHIGGPSFEGVDRYYLAIEELIEKLDLMEYVIMDGEVKDINSWFKKIDIFINNSTWESFCLALHEAMACGSYPLVHKWNGAEEFVPEENIFVQNSELKNKVLEFYSWNEKKRRQYLSKFRKTLEDRFGGNKQINEIIEVIKNL